LGPFYFTAGSEYTIFNLDGISFANLICYESSIPKIARKFINLGANFITIETNDSWCGHSSGVYQHFEIAKLRAVENRVPIARSANTGISGLILPTGKVNNKIPFNEQKVTLSSIPIKNVQSFYIKYGDWFAVICTLISPITLFFGWLQKRS
jgi:Apolipoprotein N-acyltransferase